MDSPSMVRHLDYRSQAEERRKELEALRAKSLANARVARLKSAKAPVEMTKFLERQRELFQEGRQRRSEAKDMLHKYRDDEEEASRLASKKKDRDEGRRRKEEAFAFLHRYRAAKESILRRSESLWKDGSPDQRLLASRLPLLKAVDACAKRWTYMEHRSEDTPSEIDLLSSMSEESDDLLEGGMDANIGTWAVVWISLMTVCSSNVVGMMLSLTLLGLHLQGGQHEEIVKLMQNSNLFPMVRDIMQTLHTLKELGMDNMLTVTEGEMESLNDIIPKTEPDYHGVKQLLRHALTDNFSHWMEGSASMLRKGFASVGNNIVIQPRIILLSELRAKALPCESTDADKEHELNCESSISENCSNLVIILEEDFASMEDIPHMDSLESESSVDFLVLHDSSVDTPKVVPDIAVSESGTVGTSDDNGGMKTPIEENELSHTTGEALPEQIPDEAVSESNGASAYDDGHCSENPVRDSSEPEEVPEEAPETLLESMYEKLKAEVIEDLRFQLLVRQSPYPRPKIIVSISTGPFKPVKLQPAVKGIPVLAQQCSEPYKMEMQGTTSRSYRQEGNHEDEVCNIEKDKTAPIHQLRVVLTEALNTGGDSRDCNSMEKQGHFNPNCDQATFEGREDSDEIRDRADLPERDDVGSIKEDMVSDDEVLIDDILIRQEEEIDFQPEISKESYAAKRRGLYTHLSLGAVVVAGIGATVMLGMKSRR